MGGLNLIDVLEGYDRAVVFDAIHTRDGTVGDWYGFTAAALRPTAHLCNVHDVNFATALAFGKRLGVHLPDDHRIYVFAVEIDDDKTFGTSLTPRLTAAYPACCDAIAREVSRLVPHGSGVAPG